jgi:hypothetical protein
MVTSEKGLQTRVVSMRNEINFVDDVQLQWAALVNSRGRA